MNPLTITPELLSVTAAARVCLGMPGYGQQTTGAGRGLWRSSRSASARIPLDIAVLCHHGSALAQNFNILWCWALNLVHRGERVDYFAMLHNDVEPEDFWLDTLIQEMEFRDLDMLSAVVPIKTTQGLTSTALEHPDKDPWRILRRLTMSEVMGLPETFTADDVGHPLLLNTGCWVCRFNPLWVKEITFTVKDRIVYSRPLDRYVAEMEPEDWCLSRKFNELGLKIGATRKVSLNHVGETRFTNQESWGSWQYDREHAQDSIVQKSDFQFAPFTMAVADPPADIHLEV